MVHLDIRWSIWWSEIRTGIVLSLQTYRWFLFHDLFEYRGKISPILCLSPILFLKTTWWCVYIFKYISSRGFSISTSKHQSFRCYEKPEKNSRQAIATPNECCFDLCRPHLVNDVTRACPRWHHCKTRNSDVNTNFSPCILSLTLN